MPPRPALRALVLLLAMALQFAALHAQAWTQVAAPPRSQLHAMAYDAARQRTVLVRKRPFPTGGLCETWEWTGGSWSQRATPVGPSAREGHAMAYDESRQRVVLFGGTTRAEDTLGTVSDETWEWDGSTWTLMRPAVSPSRRFLTSLVYDRVRSRCVLFGGTNMLLANYGQDTWEWDGSAWTQRTPSAAPSMRCGHAAAYDAARGKTVIFGGATFVGGTVLMKDTWEWDGTVWTQSFPATSPGWRFESAMCYDPVRAVCVLFGGGLASLSDTWEWNGTNWTQRSPVASPPGRAGHALVFDGRLGAPLLHGGIDSESGTWALIGPVWINLGPTTPTSRTTAWAWDFANRALLLFGGVTGYQTYFAGTWLWDGQLWRDATGPVEPSPREAFGLASDAARRQVLLFGGATQAGDNGETWIWDGASWRNASPATSPSARVHPACGYDPVRKRIVLFGGAQGTTNVALGDTWEWDGSAWQQPAPSTRPSPRYGAALTWDPNTGKMLLCGGATGSPNAAYNDTWTWDGSAWTRLAALLPEPRMLHRLTTDYARGRVVCLGGYPVSTMNPSPAEYEWNGTVWTVSAPFPQYETGAYAFDHARGVCVRYGRDGDLWEYATATPPRCVTFGKGCAGAAGVPALDARFMSHAVSGHTLVLDCERLLPSRAATLLLGAARRDFDLSAIGMPGCVLGPSAELPLGVVASTAGVATFSLALPSDPALLGRPFFGQACSADPSANSLGVSTSNGVEVRIGR